MSERKIFNFESVISEKETIQKFGYSSDSLGRTSSKFVIATCRFCGINMDIRKGFFNKSKSACHKECRFKEMSISGSPFASKEVRDKSSETNLKRWGNKCPQKNLDIKEKIRLSKKDEKFQDKIKKTFMDRYGVDNPVHIPGHSEKVKNTSLEKYGVSHFSLDKNIQDKKKKTSLLKYGVEHPVQSQEIKDKIVNSLESSVKYNTEKYKVFNFVCDNKELWSYLESGKSLSELSEIYSIDKNVLNKVLLNKKFKNRYQKIYSYPRTQKQNEIADFLQEIGIHDTLINNRDVVGFELDIYSPEKKIAIEFNGSYWHSEAVISPKQARNKHLIKSKECEKAGIKLIHIFENHWDNRKKQYKNFLRSVFHKNQNDIDARKCDLSFDSASDLMNDSHIQGSPSNSIFWSNLTFNNRIISSISLSRHHRQNSDKDSVVLSRMSFLDSLNVRGGASRMFKYAKSWAKNNGYKKIITWSDNAWTNGDIYHKLGFTLEKEYKPDYFYWDMKENIYRSKQSQQKGKIGCPKTMTERDFCLQNKLYRIWDCGKKKFFLDL